MCRWLVAGFAAIYGVALAALAIGTFGQDADPLAGVPVVLLGLPWNRLVDLAPERSWPWLAAVAPLANLLLLALLCRVLAGRQR